MHDSAMEIGRPFFDSYWQPHFTTIIELGALDVNGTLRTVAPTSAKYIGVDLEPGPSVDLVIKSNETIPLGNDSCDVLISSSMLEHDSFFWVTFLEMARVIRPGGYLYVNAPSNGMVHRFPQDCWRFYPDAGMALANWAVRSGYELNLVESFVANRMTDQWNDFVSIFHKGPSADPALPSQFLSDRLACMNVRQAGKAEILKPSRNTEDMLLLHELRHS